MCFVVVAPVSTQGEVHFDMCGSTWGEHTSLSFELSTNTLMSQLCFTSV